MLINKVWTYCRVANNNDDAVSNQYHCLKDYAKKQDLEIIGGTQDIASGLDYSRAGLKEVMNVAKKHRIDAILVKDISRIGRDMTRTLDYIREINSYGVEIIAADGKADGKILDIDNIFR